VNNSVKNLIRTQRIRFNQSAWRIGLSSAKNLAEVYCSWEFPNVSANQLPEIASHVFNCSICAKSLKIVELRMRDCVSAKYGSSQ
jgi:hypothetical protein